MKIGDKVKIFDGSWAVRVDSYEEYTSIGNCKDVFEIIGLTNDDALQVKIFGVKSCVHDVFIRNTTNGKAYLHSKVYIQEAVESLKEVTMSEVEDKFGCKVKIIK